MVESEAPEKIPRIPYRQITLHGVHRVKPAWEQGQLEAGNVILVFE